MEGSEARIMTVMGVAGSGKTTVGILLAQALGCAFLEGDSLHSTQNIEKMSHGIPLTDVDRAPWLASIHDRLLNAANSKQSLVVACSALKQQYRDLLSQGVPITWIYLKGSKELIFSRLQQRQHHYMKADMLTSQFAALEEPEDAIIVDATLSPSAVVQYILSQLRAKPVPSR
jgi:gluconokinase